MRHRAEKSLHFRFLLDRGGCSTIKVGKGHRSVAKHVKRGANLLKTLLTYYYLRTRDSAQTWSMVTGQPAVGEKNAQAPSCEGVTSGLGLNAKNRVSVRLASIAQYFPPPGTFFPVIVNYQLE